MGNEIVETLFRPSQTLRDHMVELRIKLKGETYNNALRDPSSFEYQQLARQFTRKVSVNQRASGALQLGVVVDMVVSVGHTSIFTLQAHYEKDSPQVFLSGKETVNQTSSEPVFMFSSLI